MMCRRRFVAAPRWLLPLLALLVVLGHACELPAYVNLVASAQPTEDAGHHTHGQTHETELLCDPVDVAASTGSVEARPALGAAQATFLDSVLPVQLRIASVEGSTRPPSRPPLFLLHASLLI